MNEHAIQLRRAIWRLRRSLADVFNPLLVKTVFKGTPLDRRFPNVWNDFDYGRLVDEFGDSETGIRRIVRIVRNYAFVDEDARLPSFFLPIHIVRRELARTQLSNRGWLRPRFAPIRLVLLSWFWRTASSR